MKFTNREFVANSDFFRRLDESDILLIGYLYEGAYVINKITYKETYVGDFYGDPTCGIISKNNDWCLFGGVSLILWKATGDIISLQEDDAENWICKMKQTGPFEFEFLIDPNSDNAAIWQLNIQTLEKMKTRHIETYSIEDIDGFIW